MDNNVVLNQYGEPATHDDCIDNFDGQCKGKMVYYESYNGGIMIRCEHHANKAYAKQDKISKYYNLGIQG